MGRYGGCCRKSDSCCFKKVITYEGDPLNIKFGPIVRGSEKIFVRCVVSGAQGVSSFRLMAITNEGISCPSILAPLDNGEAGEGAKAFVCCVPDLATAGYTLRVAETLADGSDVDSSSFSFTSSRAKWESRVNYKLHKDVCASMRDRDRIAQLNKASIALDEVIEGLDCFIVRFSVLYPELPDEDVSIELLDMALRSVDTKIIDFGGSVYDRRIGFNDLVRERVFSIRIPKDLHSYLVNVTSNSRPEVNRFEVFSPAMLEQVRQKTFEMMKNAAQDPFYYPERYNNVKPSTVNLQVQENSAFPCEPVFSIIVPLFKTPLSFFDDMLQSVQAQSYKKWQLVLVNASCEDAGLSNRVRTVAKEDERIALIELEKNLGISLNTNAGIKAATGDFVCFLDHDDVLEPNILFEYARYINEHADTDVLYCDEDKLLSDGSLALPFFKPDFNLDLLRSRNYICHMLTIRKDLLDNLEPNTPEFDGAQDHNLTFEAVEKARHVGHVPLALYHWRISETSTAGNDQAKAYTSGAGIKAVRAHLNRMGIDAIVVPSRISNAYAVTYAVPSNQPLVSIIIPTKDHIGVLKRCVDSILEKSTYPNYEVLILENNSSQPETFDYYSEISTTYPERVRILTWKDEFNFSKLMNFGRNNAKGDYLLLLNNDTEVITSNWIELMLGTCARSDVGCVGVKLFYPDGTIQHAGVVVCGSGADHLNKYIPRGVHGYFGLDDLQQDLSAVTAACLMVSTKDFDAVGGFTEELAVAFNDVDFCLKLRERDLLVVYNPEVELYHYESISRGGETTVEKEIRFRQEFSYLMNRWASYYVLGDPYSNPNFDISIPKDRYYHL